MDDDDIWVGESGHRPRLELKSLDEVLVCGIVRRQDLDGDVAVKMLLSATVYTRHAALAQQLLDEAMANSYTNQVIIRRHVPLARPPARPGASFQLDLSC